MESDFNIREQNISENERERAREVVHFQRFGEALQSLQDQLNSKNFYQMNPSFDIGLTREPCDCQGECVQ